MGHGIIDKCLGYIFSDRSTESKNEVEETASAGIVIDNDLCIDCGECAIACPVDAIQENVNGYYIDGTLCMECMACVKECPMEAIS